MSILVIGASGGVGRVLTNRLVLDGYTVISHYYSTKYGPHPVQADLREEDEVRAMFDGISRWEPPLNAIIYAAGIHEDHRVAQMPVAEWNDVLRINLTGAFLCARYGLPVMRDGGRVVFMSSIVGQVGVPGCSNYAASEAGLKGFVRTLAREVAPRGITVNTVALGYTECGMIRDVPSDHLGEIVKQTPIGRLVTGAEIYALVKYLIGPDAGAMTGQTINLNGGLYLG